MSKKRQGLSPKTTGESQEVTEEILYIGAAFKHQVTHPPVPSNLTALSPFFSADRLHIYFEIEENSTLELAAQRLVYSIKIITLDQTIMPLVGSLIVDVTKLEREITYRLLANGTFCLIAHGIAVKIACTNDKTESMAVLTSAIIDLPSLLETHR